MLEKTETKTVEKLIVKMRITGGKDRGKWLTPPRNFKARPTTDFAKEGLLNILTNRIKFEESSLLDLFAGSGNITYEFASRGSQQIVAVEINHHYCNYIRSTAEKLNYPGIKVVRDDVFHFLEICKLSFNIIFADPPYDLKEIEKIPDKIFGKRMLNSDGNQLPNSDGKSLLTPGGLFILEHPKQFNFQEHPNFLKKYRYGSVNFTFFTP